MVNFNDSYKKYDLPISFFYKNSFKLINYILIDIITYNIVQIRVFIFYFFRSTQERKWQTLMTIL